jgi:hypothetical protein
MLGLPVLDRRQELGTLHDRQLYEAIESQKFGGWGGWGEHWIGFPFFLEFFSIFFWIRVIFELPL